MGEVAAHQGFDALGRIGPGEVQPLGNALLQFVAQDVGVAARRQVKDAAHAQEEVLGLFEVVLVDRRRIVRQGGEQAGRHDVAQAARRLLDVRFELIDRVVERVVAGGRQPQQRFDDALAGFARQAGAAAIDVREQRGAARQQPCVGLREQEGRVADFDRQRFLERAHLMADRQAEIPERMEHALDERLLGRADVAGEDEQQIDVRVRRQRAAPIAAERRDGHVDRRRGERGPDQAADQVVHVVGEPRVRRAAAQAALHGGRELLAGRREELTGSPSILDRSLVAHSRARHRVQGVGSRRQTKHMEWAGPLPRRRLAASRPSRSS